MVNLLLEKYLMGFKINQSDIRDVFINPTKKEVRELLKKSPQNSYRFIADAKYKNFYAFSDDTLHEITWNNYIRKEIGDNRKLYISVHLFAGVVKDNPDDVTNWGYGGMYGRDVELYWLKNHGTFEWTKKWANIEGWLDKL